MSEITPAVVENLRNEHQIIERWLCGARSYPMIINHGSVKHPRDTRPRSQVCTEPKGHKGDHEDKRHCYSFHLHHFPESQVERYEPEDWSSCSCGRRDCPIPRLLDALEAAWDQQPEVDPEDTVAARLRRAVARLEETRDGLHPWQNLERERLSGKIEGIKLAASYLDEGERIFEAVRHD